MAGNAAKEGIAVGAPLLFSDGRPAAAAQRKIQEMASASARVSAMQTIQQMADHYTAKSVLPLHLSAPGLAVRPSGQMKTVQKAGLEELSTPRVNQLPHEEFELQKSIMDHLSGVIAQLPEEGKADVYRLGTVELALEQQEIRPEFKAPVLPVPSGLAEGAGLVGDDEALKQAIVTNVMQTLDRSGQMNYIRTNNLINENWRIIVDVDFYFQRPPDAIGFHKDTIGRSLFVNLNFNNEQEIMGPEYILNPPPVGAHDAHIDPKLPDVFKQDLVGERQRLGAPEEISATRIPAHGMVSFVDEMVHHSTPFFGHRGLDFTHDELAEVARTLEVGKKLTTLMSGTSKAKGNSRDFLRDYIGLDERQLDFLFDRVIGDSVPTGYIITKLNGNEEFEKMKALTQFRGDLAQVQAAAQENRTLSAENLLQGGLSRPFIEFLIKKYNKQELSTVNLAGCEDDCNVDTHSQQYPVMGEGGPRLRRQMSQILDANELPPPAAGKRQFFRTWVQALPR